MHKAVKGCTRSYKVYKVVQGCTGLYKIYKVLQGFTRLYKVVGAGDDGVKTALADDQGGHDSGVDSGGVHGFKKLYQTTFNNCYTTFKTMYNSFYLEKQCSSVHHCTTV